MRRLPPLNALRAFEAAARHLSFTRAAEELFVTPAAVSQQVRALEDHVGRPLFRRLTRALLLTDAGQAALPLITEGLDRLAEGAARLSAPDRGGTLTVSAAPSFAARWLVRRLHRFQEAHPELNVRIDTSMALTDFARDGVDVAVRFGLGGYSGLRADRLLAEEVFPVCSPSLREGPRPLREPADLRHHTLLHASWRDESDAWPDWRMWLTSAGVEDVDPERGPVFSDESLAIQTAIDGHGVVLANTAVAADDMAEGRLIQPFDLVLPTNFAYWVVAPEETADEPRIKAFREWIMAEAGAGAGTGTGTGNAATDPTATAG